MVQKFTAYWGGYFDSPLTLDLTPSCVDIVSLAFSGPLADSTLETTYLCSKYPDVEIIDWARKLQERGQKVTMSLLDTPQTHWHQVNKLTFAESVKEIVFEKWNLDGLDIDAESGMPDTVFVLNFVDLISTLRKVNGGKFPMSYTCYTGINGPDKEIINLVKNKIDFIQLMAYFDDTSSMKSLFMDYATIFPEDKINIGVKAGKQSGCTPIPEVINLSQWKKNTKGGMMLWTLNRDYPSFTGQVPWYWANTIRKSIN